MTLEKCLESHGLRFTPIFTGKIERYGDQWCLGYAEGDKQSLIFGDWKRGGRLGQWQSEGMSPSEAEAFFAKIEEAQLEDKEHRERVWNTVAVETALWTEGRWEKDVPSPYLARKGVPGSWSTYFDRTDATTVCLLQDCKGKVWSYQKISEDGTKSLAKGGKAQGCFIVVQPGEGDIFVAEGVATAASIAKALGPGPLIIAARSCNNLRPVCEALRREHPQAVIYLCADDDWKTAENPGQAHAKACLDLPDTHLLTPRFPANRRDKDTDWNDLHKLAGFDEVVEQLHAGLRLLEVEVPKEKKLTEYMVASGLLQRLGDPEDFICQGQDLFRYTGTHWEAWNTRGHELRLKGLLQQLHHGKLSAKAINASYQQFLWLIPQVPEGVNLFAPSRHQANFQDGTLTVHRDLVSNTYTTTFTPHQRGNFLTWVNPVTWEGGDDEENPLLEKAFTEALGHSPSAGDYRLMLEELAALIMMPLWYRLFLLYGLSGARKSTLLQVLLKLQSLSNMSMLRPSQFEGFMLQAAIGKLVNFHTDIGTDALPSWQIKSGEDSNAPQLVNRKNKDPVAALLPRLNVYCCNTLPRNMEGSIEAIDRRVSLIEFTATAHRPGENIPNYEDTIWAAGPVGVRNWGKRGFARLLANYGRCYSPTASAESVKAWRVSGDPVAQFFAAVDSGELRHTGIQGNDVTLARGPERRILRVHLRQIFHSWINAAYNNRAPSMGLYALHREFEKHLGKPHNVQGPDGKIDLGFVGIGVD